MLSCRTVSFRCSMSNGLRTNASTPSCIGGSVSDVPLSRQIEAPRPLRLDHRHELGPVAPGDMKVEQDDVDGLLREQLGGPVSVPASSTR